MSSPSTLDYLGLIHGDVAMFRRKNVQGEQHQHDLYEYNNNNKSECQTVLQIEPTEWDEIAVVRWAKSLLSSATFRSGFYIFAVIVLGLIGDRIDQASYAKAFYPARKDNALNIYFVKLAWGWNLALLFPLLAVAAKSAISFLASIARLAIATGVWFGAVRLFDDVIQVKFGGFDVSGHCFILVWGILVIVDEAGFVNSASTSKSTSALVRSMLVFCALLVLLWDVMFLSTTMFYHTTAEKAAGVAVAVIAHVLLYRLIYPCFRS